MHLARIVIGIVACLLLLWALVIVVVASRAYFLMFRPRNDSSEQSLAYCLEQGDFDESFLALAWESVRVPSPRGYELATVTLPAGESSIGEAAVGVANATVRGSLSSGTAIFVHGFTSTHYSMMKYMRRFAERGWNVVAFDLAGSGASVVPRKVAKSPSFGFYEKGDLAAVVEWTRRRFPGAQPVVLVGESMGAATVLEYAPIGAPAGTDAAHWSVDAIIADCPFSSAAEELTARLRAEGVPRFTADGAAAIVSYALARLRGFRPEDAAPLRSILESPIPILLVHGGDDLYVPTEMSIRMADERRRSGIGPTELLVISGARHAKSVVVDPASWFSTVFAFIDKYASNRTDG